MADKDHDERQSAINHTKQMAPMLVEQSTGNQPEQPKHGIPADLLFGLGVVLALPALALLYYVFVAFSYAFKGIAAFYFQYGVVFTFLAVGVALCVFIYRYGMQLAAEHGEA